MNAAESMCRFRAQTLCCVFVRCTQARFAYNIAADTIGFAGSPGAQRRLRERYSIVGQCAPDA
jgi:hypothetical protein